MPKQAVVPSNKKSKGKEVRPKARPVPRSVAPAAGVAARRRGLQLNLAFFRDTLGELRKVTWPTREEATKLTTIVIIVSASVGLSLGLIDFIFARLVNLLLAPGG